MRSSWSEPEVGTQRVFSSTRVPGSALQTNSNLPGCTSRRSQETVVSAWGRALTAATKRRTFEINTYHGKDFYFQRRASRIGRFGQKPVTSHGFSLLTKIAFIFRRCVWFWGLRRTNDDDFGIPHFVYIRFLKTSIVLNGSSPVCKVNVFLGILCSSFISSCKCK